jgi:putative transcriptional regulator
MNKHNIHIGTALITEPFALEQTFKRAVVLICEHKEEEGTVGFIVNKKTDFVVHELIENFPKFEAHVYMGGPVAPETLHYIHNVGDLLEGSVEISRGIYWGGHFDKLKFLIESELIKPKNIRFFLGYSGWDPGQLYDEIDTGSWIIEEIHANYIFKEAPEKLWKQILINKGNTFSVIAQMKDSTRVN